MNMNFQIADSVIKHQTLGEKGSPRHLLRHLEFTPLPWLNFGGSSARFHLNMEENAHAKFDAFIHSVTV